MVTNAYKKAIQRLWTGRASITVREGVTNEKTGRTEPVERIVASDVPCRISFAAVKSAQLDGEAAKAAQTVTLYIGPGLEIPEGSSITVTQNGVTADYERSGTPAVYSSHQEVPLELVRRWA